MHEQNRSPIPTALVCVLLLLVLVLGGGVVGIMYSHSQKLQAVNSQLNAAIAAQRAESQKMERKNAELSTIIEHQHDQAGALKADNEQLRAQLDALKAESE